MASGISPDCLDIVWKTLDQRAQNEADLVVDEPVRKQTFYSAYLPYLLSQVAHQLGVTHHRELKKRRIRESEWRVLTILSGDSPKTVNDLARDTLIPQSTLSRRLVRMEEKGWLERSPSPHDGRSYLFSLSISGEGLADELNDVAKLAEAQDTEDMSEEELRQLRRLLKKLVPNSGN